MRENWERSVANILLWEGGWAERPNEPGGAVNKGVSFLAFQEWRKSIGAAVPSLTDLKALSTEEAKAIYKRKYADPIGFDNLPPGYDYALLTAAVMTGPNRGKPEQHRPGAAWYHEEAKGDLGLLLVLMMRAKMHDPSCGPHTIPGTKRKQWYGPGWSDRFLSVYKLAKELEGDAALATKSPEGRGT
jgi:hypothetical protein